MQGVLQDFGFFFWGGVGCGTQKFYFGRCQGYLKRGAFAGGWEVGSLSEDRRILKIYRFFQRNNIKFGENCKIVKKFKPGRGIFSKIFQIFRKKIAKNALFWPIFQQNFKNAELLFRGI